ncbi:hypothetical protein LMH87_000785 [Akanthomyces muscarius]|uniref:DUF7587 domain-containing protein n=1 Tax=Akanthomyces muscarius TaxID=2231603 RepID=A0A9W8QG16_AKAMU|nr:hypothetical protein LMH87_000785 [Akanthomyces muscarius]KAJ4155546.1 hypothetical protein LMH87_000785 [Akanthomyces muscarius]
MAPRNRGLGSSLATNLETLHILESNQNGVPFRPPSGFRPTLNVPRYLFRVCSSGSAGLTTPDLAQSASAASNYALSRTCLFRLDDASLAADMVFKHLTWASPRAADNLVSWTSSLLTALVYVFYRHARFRESFDDISLYVVDTTRFPDLTFICDLDLIRAFRQHSGALANLEALRHRKHSVWAGSYHFGEYLSQGSLGLTGRCCSGVSARRMMDGGLLDLHPRFAEFAQWARGEEDWASLVVQLREPFYARSGSARRQVYPNDAQIMSRIGNLFGVGWRAPVAVALLALAPNRMGATDLLLNFRLLGPMWNPVLEECFDAAAAVNPSNMLPEVTEFQYNLNDAYLEFCELKVGTCIDSVIDTLQVAQQLITTIESTRHSPSGIGRAEKRKRLFDLVRTLGGMIEHVFPDKSASGEGGGEDIEEDT